MKRIRVSLCSFCCDELIKSELMNRTTKVFSVYDYTEIYIDRVVFFYWSALKMTKCQTLRKF